MSDIQSFRDAIEAFIAVRGWTPTRFGRQMAGDPLFVFDLREGREPPRKLGSGRSPSRLPSQSRKNPETRNAGNAGRARNGRTVQFHSEPGRCRRVEV